MCFYLRSFFFAFRVCWYDWYCISWMCIFFRLKTHSPVFPLEKKKTESLKKLGLLALRFWIWARTHGFVQKSAKKSTHSSWCFKYYYYTITAAFHHVICNDETLLSKISVFYVILFKFLRTTHHKIHIIYGRIPSVPGAVFGNFSTSCKSSHFKHNLWLKSGRTSL